MELFLAKENPRKRRKKASHKARHHRRKKVAVTVKHRRKRQVVVRKPIHHRRKTKTKKRLMGGVSTDLLGKRKYHRKRKKVVTIKGRRRQKSKKVTMMEGKRSKRRTAIGKTRHHRRLRHHGGGSSGGGIIGMAKDFGMEALSLVPITIGLMLGVIYYNFLIKNLYNEKAATGTAISVKYKHCLYSALSVFGSAYIVSWLIKRYVSDNWIVGNVFLGMKLTGILTTLLELKQIFYDKDTSGKGHAMEDLKISLDTSTTDIFSFDYMFSKNDSSLMGFGDTIVFDDYGNPVQLDGAVVDTSRMMAGAVVNTANSFAGSSVFDPGADVAALNKQVAKMVSGATNYAGDYY